MVLILAVGASALFFESSFSEETPGVPGAMTSSERSTHVRAAEFLSEALRDKDASNLAELVHPTHGLLVRLGDHSNSVIRLTREEISKIDQGHEEFLIWPPAGATELSFGVELLPRLFFSADSMGGAELDALRRFTTAREPDPSRVHPKSPISVRKIESEGWIDGWRFHWKDFWRNSYYYSQKGHAYFGDFQSTHLARVIEPGEAARLLIDNWGEMEGYNRETPNSYFWVLNSNKREIEALYKKLMTPFGIQTEEDEAVAILVVVKYGAIASQTATFVRDDGGWYLRAIGDADWPGV